MELKKVLLIDDIASVREDVMNAFMENGVEVLPAKDVAEMEQYLTSRDFQIIILDWLLDGESSTLAKVCLKLVRKTCFVPVLIWTEEIAVYENEKEDLIEVFPQACLTASSKSETNIEKLLEFLENWYGTTPAKLSHRFRESISSSVEEALYTLADYSEDELARGLKTLISLGDASDIDMEHVVDVLLRLVGRAIYADEEFSNEIRQTVTTLEHSPKKSKKIESRIKELHMYYEPKDDLVRTGDIVNITFGGEQEKQLAGIAMTPACDLATPQKTAFLRLALIHKTDEQGQDKWWLDKEEKLKVCFHEILVLENTNLSACANPKERTSVMLYTHSYQTLDGTSVTLKRSRRLDEPYRSDLLHSFVSHAGRIGMPEFTAAT